MLSPRLTTLLSVAGTLNFTRSAEELSLTQPAVSQHIKLLEEELDIKIFIRSQRELRLTEEGKVAVEYAKKIRALWSNLERDLRDEKSNVRRLTVGVTPTAESNYISQILALYGSQNSKMHITIITDVIRNLYDKLRNYEIDLAIVEGSLPDPALRTILLDTDYLVLAVANDNALSKKSMVTLSELKREKLILRLPDSGTRTLFEQALLANHESLGSFNVILEVDNNSTIKELVESNFGVSVISRISATEDVRKKKFRVLPIENLSMVREISIVYPGDFRHTSVLDDIAALYGDTVRKGAR